MQVKTIAIGQFTSDAWSICRFRSIAVLLPGAALHGVLLSAHCITVNRLHCALLLHFPAAVCRLRQPFTSIAVAAAVTCAFWYAVCTRGKPRYREPGVEPIIWGLLQIWGDTSVPAVRIALVISHLNMLLSAL
jgi:hypothetical protein